MMQTMYEAVGHATWVAMQRAAGATVPASVAKAKVTTHRFNDCRKAYNCPEHRAAYRRNLKAKKAAIAATTAAEQLQNNMLAMHRVGGAR